MSSSLLKRFMASRESAPVESPLDKPSSIHDDGGKVVAAVEPAAPSTSDTQSGPGLHAAGLPAEPVTTPVDATGAAKDESADAHVVAAVKPAKPSSSDASGLPANPVVEPKAETAAVADDKADAEGKTVAAVQSVTPTHANEDLDPGAAQLQPASVIVPMPDHAQETEAAYRAVEEAALHHAVEELDRVQAGLEGLRDRINTANASGGLAAESAFFASFAVESLLKRFEIEDEAIVGSFESAVVVPDGRTVVSTEALDATLEAVDNAATTMLKRGAATAIRGARLYGGAILQTLAAKSNVIYLMGLVSSAQKLKGKSTDGATIKVRRMLLPAADESGKDLPGQIQKVATILEYLLRDFQKQASADYEYNVELVHKHATAGLDEAAYAKILADWRDPRRKMGDAVSGALFGNVALFKDQSLKYHGDNETAKGFDKIANLEYPEVALFQADSSRHFFRKTMREKVEIPALKPEEIIKITHTFQKAIKAVSFWQNIVESVAANATITPLGAVIKLLRRSSHHGPASNASRHAQGGIGRDELDALKDALATSNRLRLHVGADAMWVIAQALGAFRSAAKRSLNAIAKASVEAFDQQNSVDGVSVNETAPNEPRQVPAEGNTATEKELMAKQDSWEDRPASFQTIEDEVGVEAIDFDEAVSACESLMDEVGELAILSQHYATEDEASGEAKPRPGMIERFKALIAKIGEFFRGVWKRIVQFVTQQGNRLADWAKKVKQHHFDKKTVKITGSMDAYINDMKLPNLTPFFDFMDEAAGAGENLVHKLERHVNVKMNIDAVVDANIDFMSLKTEAPIPAEGMVGAFKLSNDDGKLVEVQVVKKIGEDREYTVTGSTLATFVEGAARLVKKTEARVKAFEMKSDADWKRAKEVVDGLQVGFIILKPYSETARFLMKAFSVLQSWARAVGNFADLCIKDAGEKLRKSERDDIVDAKFTPAAEARADLPYWYRPLEA